MSLSNVKGTRFYFFGVFKNITNFRIFLLMLVIPNLYLHIPEDVNCVDDFIIKESYMLSWLSSFKNIMIHAKEKAQL